MRKRISTTPPLILFPYQTILDSQMFKHFLFITITIALLSIFSPSLLSNKSKTLLQPQTSSITNTMSIPRTISKIFLALEQAEGAGATVRRSIGSAQLRQLSPFLLLDHFSSSSLAGFPDHPHRGQGRLCGVWCLYNEDDPAPSLESSRNTHLSRPN